jgi:phage host-nuclease inhibitor protein Gam
MKKVKESDVKLDTDLPKVEEKTRVKLNTIRALRSDRTLNKTLKYLADLPEEVKKLESIITEQKEIIELRDKELEKLKARIEQLRGE